jgi:two-component system phosphate regulon response regulator PhoB
MQAPLEVHGLSIHPGRREVMLKGEKIDLTNMEFRVLYFLASQPGWVHTRYQIVEGVRGENYPVTDRSVDVLMTGLRKKLGAAGTHIETVRGVGYRFSEEE